MKKNILITGASGFIGSFLVEEALKRGYRVFAGVRSSSSREYLLHPEISFVETDIGNRHKLEEMLLQSAEKYGSFDYIIHTAGLTKTMDHFAYTRVNFGGTQNLVEALQNTGLVPEKFIYISSLASYGPGGSDHKPIDPDAPQHPVTAYGRSKLLAEQFLYRHENFPFLIINPTTVYGPRDKDFFFLIQSIRNGVELYIGNRNQLLSFVHVQDLVNAIMTATESDLVQKKLIVSDLLNYTAAEMNGTVKKILQQRTLSLVVPAWMADIFAIVSEYAGNVKGTVPIVNRERLKEFKAANWSVDASLTAAMGYQPMYSLEDGLRNTIDWYHANGWLKKRAASLQTQHA